MWTFYLLKVHLMPLYPCRKPSVQIHINHCQGKLRFAWMTAQQSVKSLPGSSFSSIGRLDLNDGSWCLIFEDLGDQKTGTLANAYHIVCCIGIHDGLRT